MVLFSRKFLKDSLLLVIVMKKKVDISIVLPVYNEEVILERSVLDLYSYLKNSDLTNNFEIVLCLNGCTDKSVVISNKLSDKLKEVCVLISKKKGVGVGILLGLKKARYEYILTMGVDIPFGLSIIEESICAIQKTCADIIIQSKNHSKSNVKGSFKRKFFSFCYNKFINLIYDLHIKDTQGPFLIRKNSLNKIILFINSSTSFIKTQILIYSVLFNMKMVEIPVNYVIRSDSKINFFIEGLKMFFESLKEFFKFGNVSIIKNLLRYDSSSYNYPLSNVTTLKIGGNATFFFKPRTINDIKTIILFSKKNKIPLFMLGAGSNVLFCDDGFNGVVVSFEKQFSFINKLSDEKIEVGGGTLVSDVLSFCFENDFGGLEFLSLIPGTIGGIVSMNAGAFEEEIGTYVFEVKAIDLNGKEFVFSKKAADFSYRSSIFLKKKLIIT